MAQTFVRISLESHFGEDEKWLWLGAGTEQEACGNADTFVCSFDVQKCDTLIASSTVV